MNTSSGTHTWRRIGAMAKKEVAHILRDKFTLVLALVFPVIIVLIFGLAIEFNIKNIPTAYLDSDKTLASRRLIEAFGSSEYFRMTPVHSSEEGIRLIESERVRAFIVIPPSFEKDVMAGMGADVQVLVDAADNQSAGSILNYLGTLQGIVIEKITGRATPETVQIRTRFLFNPELSSKWFIIPGLVVVIMAILSILLTSLTVAREWENGSMELLLSTPVRPSEIILGKLAPYAGLCLIAVGMVYLFSRVVFGVPFKGNHAVFLLGCCLFLVTYLAQGLVISVLTRRQVLAMQAAMLSGLLPSLLLSGFIFPIESMPVFFRYFTMILPARWFMVIARDSFLKGSSLWALREPFLALGLIALVFITIAVRNFKRDVEP